MQMPTLGRKQRLFVRLGRLRRYTESGIMIPGLFGGERVNFTAQMYLDDEAAIAGGRETGAFQRSTADRNSRSRTNR
jgi:acetoacetate decarboxylase